MTAKVGGTLDADVRAFKGMVWALLEQGPSDRWEDR